MAEDAPGVDDEVLALPRGRIRSMHKQAETRGQCARLIPFSFLALNPLQQVVAATAGGTLTALFGAYGNRLYGL